MGEAWGEWRIQDAKLFDVDGDRVVGAVRVVGKGKGSGVPVDQEVGLVRKLRNGKLWRGRSYIDPADALEAVGLSSWPEDAPRSTPS
jgi:ketosteroid isomerase-like protein